MRLAIVSNLYPPYARGGAEQIAWRTAHALYARGHKVSVLSTMPYGGPFSAFRLEAEPQLETVYRFYPPNLYHPLSAAAHPFPARALWHLIDLYSPLPAGMFRRLAAEERPDAVLTHNLKGIGLQIAAAIRRLGLPHVHTLHDVQLSVPSGLLMYGREDAFLNRGACRWWYEGQVRRTVGSPGVVISPSHWLADFYRSRHLFGGSRMEVLPNPAPEMPPGPRGSRPDGAPLSLLFAGQLEEHKGLRFLLKTLGALDVPFLLHVAGDGTLSREVAAWARHDPRVVYHGFVSLDNLMKLFAISDAAVVPSLCYENSPTVIYEALLAGVPVVASRLGGVGELVRDEKNGLLVTPGRRDEWLAAFRRLNAEADAWRAKAGEIQQAMEPYRLGHYVDRLEQLMAEAIASP